MAFNSLMLTVSRWYHAYISLFHLSKSCGDFNWVPKAKRNIKHGYI